MVKPLNRMRHIPRAHSFSYRIRCVRYAAELLEPRILLAANVYSDALVAPWQNWSWGSQVDLAQSNVVHQGTHAISARFEQAWAGLYLASPTRTHAATTDEIRFSIHGGTSTQAIRFSLVDGSNQWITAADLGSVATQWTDVIVDLSAIGNPTEISGLVWQEFTGDARSIFYVDDIVIGDFLPDVPVGPSGGPTLTVDPSTVLRPINPDIYGMSYADPQLATDIDLPVNRWGGNATSRYNYQNDAANRGSDWFFENIPEDNPNPAILPLGSSADRFVAGNQSRGADSLMTVGMLGWMPRSREIIGGFDVKYGAQKATDPYRPNFGNGIRPDGSLITENDPFDTSIPVDETFAAGWVQHLVTQFGTANHGGVKYYALDNEPMLWNSTHRDVHPQPATYDEVFGKGRLYAAAVKQIDPTAQVLGPTVWGWTAYFYSALDAAGPGNWWLNPTDRNAHGGQAFLPWYLAQMAQAEATTGQRLLDYLDIHYYPQATGVSLSPVGDASIQAERLRSTRSLWDPTYVDSSWINDKIQLIPRMRAWIDQYYPGTKLAITEYNWGGTESVNGALAEADVLGIFGREGVDLAAMWSPPDANDPAGYAFRMFRNYDGSHQAGGRFGDWSLAAHSTNSDQVSIFAARRNDDDALTVMLVNKSPAPLTTSLLMQGYGGASVAERYVYDASHPLQILRVADLPLIDGKADLSLPGYSITLLEIAPNRASADLNQDGSVDAADAAMIFANWGQAGQGDLNLDGIVDAADAGELFAQWTGDAGIPRRLPTSDVSWDSVKPQRLSPPRRHVDSPIDSTHDVLDWLSQLDGSA